MKQALSFIYLEKARQSFFSQTVEAKNMADFWRIMTPFDAFDVISMATAKGSNR